MSPEELTRLNMDKSALLRRLIEEYGGEALMLLGELQVSISQTLYSMSLSRTKILRCCGAWGEPCSMCIASRIGTRSGQLVIMQDWKHMCKHAACHLVLLLVHGRMAALSSAATTPDG